MCRVRILTVLAVVVVAGCVARGDGSWPRSLVVTVHWERYKSANAICSRIMPPRAPSDSDMPQIAFGSVKLVGTDCYVYTDENRVDIVGGLAQDCFEQIQKRQTKS